MTTKPSFVFQYSNESSVTINNGFTNQNKLYQRFRSSDAQINFLMSEKGELSLDREIKKMMQQMNIEEIVQFADQFFKSEENQCGSLRSLVQNQLNSMMLKSMQMDKNEYKKQQKHNDVDDHDQSQSLNHNNTKTNKMNNRDMVDVVDSDNRQKQPKPIKSKQKYQFNVPYSKRVNENVQQNLLAAMTDLSQALNLQLATQKTKRTNDKQDRIDFEKINQNIVYEEYTPKIKSDDQYLTNDDLGVIVDFQNDIDVSHNVEGLRQQQIFTKQVQQTCLPKIDQLNEIDFDAFQKLPKQYLLPQNQLSNDKQLSKINKKLQEEEKVKQNQHRQRPLNTINDKLRQQQEEQLEDQLQNPPPSDSNPPTTIEQDLQLQFEQLQRIELPDNKFKIIYNNGDEYEGQLENEMKNGWGDYLYNTGEKYQGFFMDDQIHGYGQYFFLSGASYEGDWSSGMKHGVGILKFSNGDHYEGHFVKDLFHGKGTYTYANGDVFTGTWKNGQKHGKGKLQTYDGSLQIGNWVNDKFQI